MGERVSVWATSLHGAGGVWKTGVGFGLIEESLLKREGYNSAAHSIPLTILVETGILGLLLYMITWFWPVFKITTHPHYITRTTAGTISLLVALFVHQLFDSSVLRYHWLNFVFAALLGLTLNIERNNEFSTRDQRAAE